VLVIPTQGAELLLRFMFGQADPVADGWSIVMYENDYTPLPSSVFADFTFASFPGGDPIGLDLSGWGDYTVVSDRVKASYIPSFIPQWTNGGSTTTVYGYLVYDATETKVLFAERFDTPRVLNPAGSITIYPTFDGGTFIPCV